MAKITTITNPLTGQPAQVDQLDHTAQQIDDGIGFESTDYPGCYYRTVDGVTEWVNPPMNPGKEYRTTERYQGKPVYVKAVSIDGLPNNGIKTFSWSNSYTNVPFFVTGQALRSNGGSYMSLPTDVYYSLSGSLMNGMVSISAIERQIAIKTDFDATSFDTVTVCVKYTKTTD